MYRVPKEADAISNGSDAAPAPAADGADAATAVHWKAPAEWTEQPATGFRKGFFLVPGPNGQKAEVSVVSVPSASGGLLSNVNRWRDQLQLAPIVEAGLKDAGSILPVAGHNVFYVDLVSEKPILDGGKSRVLGGILPLTNETWFFKMGGPDSLVESQKELFQSFLRSVQLDVADAQQPPPMEGVDTPEPSVQAPPAPTVHYDLPPGWQEKPLTPMRVASFRIPGGASGDADASIVFLVGPAGGELSNINRWRGQIGLEPITEESLATLTTHVQAHGHDFTLVDLLGSAPPSAEKARERMLAAILFENNQSWFVKMTGPDELVATQRAAFTGLLQSLIIPQ